MNRPPDDIRPVVPPIFLTAGFEERDDPPGTPGLFSYSRYGNPTVGELETALAGLEGAQAAAVFASGMGAIHAVLAAFVGRGAAAVFSRHVYPGTESLARFLAEQGTITPRFVDPEDVDEVRTALAGARLLWLELPANPTLHVPALASLAGLAHRQGARVVVDATLATPVLARPLRDGADLVVHSLTKYVSGGGDVLGGAVLGGRTDVEHVRRVGSAYMGNVPSPLNAFLLLRALDSLHVRVRAQSSAAAGLARWLSGRLGADRVRYPVLGGGVVTFSVEDADEVLARVAESTMITRAPSLGDSRTLISLLRPERFPPAARAALLGVFGSAGSVFRLSVGLEDPAALQAELARVLGGAGTQTTTASAGARNPRSRR